MRDITLRFDNREQFNAIVYDSGLFSLEEENGILVDVIGGIIDYEEPENERCTGIDRGGFFVNMRIVDGSKKHIFFNAFHYDRSACKDMGLMELACSGSQRIRRQNNSTGRRKRRIKTKIICN